MGSKLVRRGTGKTFVFSDNTAQTLPVFITTFSSLHCLTAIFIFSHLGSNLGSGFLSLVLISLTAATRKGLTRICHFRHVWIWFMVQKNIHIVWYIVKVFIEQYIADAMYYSCGLWLCCYLLEYKTICFVIYDRWWCCMDVCKWVEGSEIVWCCVDTEEYSHIQVIMQLVHCQCSNVISISGLRSSPVWLFHKKVKPGGTYFSRRYFAGWVAWHE